MKNNKGYTLIELLVAMAIFAIIMLEIFSMMNNSSKLYLNGTYEIDLQTEAQQVVQQLEELLIDANVSVNVIATGNPSVNNIRITNHDIEYYIEYKPAVSADPSVSYGNLYLSATGAYTATEELMAEYVESISFNMAEYNSTSKITLEIVMRNPRYSYSTTKDIYLRNDIGISGNRAHHSAEGSYSEELDVLRFKEYNLSALYNDGETYTYQFSDGTTYNSDYVITSSGGTYYLKASNTLNNDFNRTGGDYLIDAIDASGNKAFSIKISTMKVKIGADGFGLFCEYTDISDKVTSPVHVEGIYLGAAEEIRWELLAVQSGTGTSLRTATGSNYDGGTSHRFPGDLYVQVDSLKGYINDDWNSIIFEGQRMMNHENYYQAIRNGGIFKMITSFKFPSCPNILYVNSYMYPSSANVADAMPDDVAEIFWSQCN